MGLGFEGEAKEMSRPIEVFNIFQKKTKTRVHLKVDESMEFPGVASCNGCARK